MPSTAMLAALGADGPHPALAEHLHLFGQFVGSWDVDITYHRPDGTRYEVAGEWHFGWVLEGRAIQDVWIAPRRELRGEPGRELGDYGTTLRFYDPALGAWRSTWIGPYKGYVMPFIARSIGAEIVLEGSFTPGQTTRWIFSEITPDTFHWRHVDLLNGSTTEVLRQTMDARRQREPG
jgi:hypothetical protein